MAIAHDTDSSTSDSETSTLSWSHTCTGSDLALVVNACNDSGLTVSGVTYNSVALAKVATGIANGNAFVENWILANDEVATGANTVEVTYSGSGFLQAGASSYTGVDQTTPVDATSTGSTGSSTNANDSVSGGSDWHVGGGVTAGEASAFTANSPTVLSWAAAVEQRNAGGGYAPTGAAISFANGNFAWACQAFSLNEAAGGGGAAPSYYQQITELQGGA